MQERGNPPKVPICSAPATAILIDVDKGVRPCCDYQGYHLARGPCIGDLRRQTLPEILTSEAWKDVARTLAEDGVPAGCSACLEREATTGWSQRQVFARFRSANWHRGITYLELNSSNVCNLQCRHCNAHFSSRWARHQSQRGRRDFPVVAPDPDLLLRNLREIDLSHLEHVSLKGGEPMLNADVAALFGHLEELGIVGNLTLHMVTNGTFVKPELLKWIERVRHGRICISVDGVDDVQTYIRHGDSSIDKIEESIAIYADLPHVSIARSTAVMPYNVFGLEAIEAWWDRLPDRFPGQYEPFEYCLFVLDPAWLSIRCLQDETRARLARRYRGFDDRRYDAVIQMLEEPFLGAEQHDQFVLRTMLVDREIGGDVLEAVPELAEEMQLVSPSERLRTAREALNSGDLETVRSCLDASADLVTGAWEDLRQGEAARALEKAEAAASLMDDSSAPIEEAGVLHVHSAAALAAGQLEEALELAERAVSLIPHHGGLQQNRALVLARMSQGAQASLED